MYLIGLIFQLQTYCRKQHIVLNYRKFSFKSAFPLGALIFQSFLVDEIIIRSFLFRVFRNTIFILLILIVNHSSQLKSTKHLFKYFHLFSIA